MQKKIEILFIIVVNVLKQTNTKKQQATSIRRWYHAALDGCTRTTTDNICQTRSASCHRSGAVRLATETTPPTYFTTLRGMNPRRMFPFY